MRDGLRIARLFGIDIRLDWSWLLIFALITLNLSAVFAQQQPEWSLALRWSLAIGTSVLFFASVLVHELAHSLTAVGQGIKVRNITLFLFGGVSNIQRQPESPGSEFLITIVGPVSSIILGVMFLVLAGLPGIMTDPMGTIETLGPAATVFSLLGSVNLVLGVFNLIPGFPLDGGRLLRSGLWAATGDLTRATRWASWVGQGIAWLLIAAGVAMIFGIQIPFFGTGFINGLWLVFIGWFLSSASRRSYQQVVIEDMLEDVPVSRLMRGSPPTVSPDITLDELVDGYIMSSSDRSFPVLENGVLIGLIALSDVREYARSEWPTTRVRQAMTPREALDTVDPNEDAAEALQKLVRRDLRQLPVQEGEQFVGLLRRQDIVKWLQLQSDGGQPQFA
ncbi:MAG: CBS domain-containing protein [Chloroflexi bacterium]|nr:CBS domain-containing protein [Chloroflexota bacterium]